MKRVLLAIALATFASAASAQQMKPRSSALLDPSFDVPAPKALPAISLTRATPVRLPSRVLDKQEQAPSRRQLLGHGRMLESEGMAPRPLPWVEAEDGRRIATLLVTSPGARQVRIGLRIGAAPEGAAIQVAPADALRDAIQVHPEQLRAAVGSILWTPATAGDTQVVQVVAPAGFVGELAGVSHLFDDGRQARAKALGDSLSCQVDVACVSSSTLLDAATKAAFNAKVNSTALMVVTSASGQTSACTGTLLNNDYGAPVFLTAQHCIGDSGEANNLITAWGYQAATCGGTTPGPFTARTGGALLMAAREELDQSVLVLREAPPSGAVLSAWHAGLTIAPGELMLGMHHPRGDLKKTGIGTITGISGAFTVGSTSYPANSFFTTSWQVGLVEPGSSGSGIFVEPPGVDYLALVGVLNSGPASGLTCAAATSYTNRYGRLNNFFPYAQRFLQNDYSRNYSDLWWNPAESGWGLNIQHQGDILFATWFTYDADGSGMWLVMSSADRVGTATYQGTLYRTRGTPFHQINGAQAVETPLPVVGTGTLTFTGANAGTFSYTVNGVSGSKPIQRQVFSTRPTCEFNLAGRTGATNYQDLWWNPDESGWGVNITHQGDILFATWFTYDDSRAGMWLVMSNGVKTGPTSYRGELYRTTGTPFSQINGTTSVNLPLPQVGTLAFTFTDGLSGTMSYTVNGISGSKAIRRQLFAYPNTVCRP